MSHSSCSMKKVANEAAVRAGKPGAFAFENVREGEETFKRLWVHLPSGFVGAFNLEPCPPSVPMPWPWNGSMTKPTIGRPIQLRGRWCGQIENGRMVGSAKEDDQEPAEIAALRPSPNPVRTAVAKAVKARARTRP